ncbi:Pre-mRNA-splicing factor Cwf15/Cwc15 [Blastocladiella britannica]|nr:Pre-mRNA-splicing factor Cwf15/Cwc15 [Blastocladiella britannica]
MTTAARPTFNPAVGGHTGRDLGFKTRIIHAKELTSHTKIKYRQKGQHSAADIKELDLKEHLRQAEREHAAKKRRAIEMHDPTLTDDIRLDGDGERASFRSESSDTPLTQKARTDRSASPSMDSHAPAAKRARRSKDDPDADRAVSSDEDGNGSSASDSSSSSDDDYDDDENDAEALMRELEKIRRERAEEKARTDREQREREDASREAALMSGNPLLQMGGSSSAAALDFTVKKRWDDDVVFKNQARTEAAGKNEEMWTNDPLRNAFHRAFIKKYIR